MRSHILSNICYVLRSEHLIDADEEMHQESPFFASGSSQRNLGEESRPLDSVMEELASITARQSELVARARDGIAGESSHLQEKISGLEAHLAALQAELASSKAEQLDSKAKLEREEVSAQRANDARLSLMAEMEKERALANTQRVNSQWAFRYLEQNRARHFENLESFRSKIQVSIRELEEKIAKINLEFDEELYPHLVQSVVERR